MISHRKIAAVLIGAAVMATGLGIHTLFFDKGEEEWGFEFLDESDPSYLLPNGNIVQRKNKKIADSKSEIQSSGTGVLLSNDGLIATCAHVVDGAARIRVKSARNTRTAEVAHVILIDPQNDLALLQIGPGLHQPSPIAEITEAKLGQEVFTIGYPNIYIQGLKPKFTRGEISGLAGMFDDPTRWQISVPVQNGNSGGPLFDMNGNVVGIIDSRLIPKRGGKDANAVVQNVNYAIKNHYLLELICKVPKFLQNLPEKRSRGFKRLEEVIEEAENSVVLILAY